MSLLNSLGNVFESIGTPKPAHRFVFFGALTYAALEITQPDFAYTSGKPRQFSINSPRQLATPVTVSIAVGLLFSLL